MSFYFYFLKAYDRIRTGHRRQSTRLHVHTCTRVSNRNRELVRKLQVKLSRGQHGPGSYEAHVYVRIHPRLHAASEQQVPLDGYMVSLYF